MEYRSSQLGRIRSLAVDYVIQEVVINYSAQRQYILLKDFLR